MRIARHFQTLSGGRQLHYLRTGEGPPVLLLHPSPLSADFLRPLLHHLGSGFDLIAMDTPGYGNSDALPEPAQSLAPYVEVIGELLRNLEVGPVLVYGNATGAQLAIESARHLGTAISALVLENAACFSDAEREAILARYFPDLGPRPDGSHLAVLWQMARQLYQYFPWYDTSEAARYTGRPPADELVQATVLAYLQAGPDYARAYRAAFHNERPENLAAVTQPVRVLQWQDSMLLPYSLRLQEAAMPGNITFTHVPSGIDARYAAIRQALLAGGGSP